MAAPSASNPSFYYLPPGNLADMSAVEAIPQASRVIYIWTPDAAYSTPNSFATGLRDTVNFPTAPADQPADWAKATALWQVELGRTAGTGGFDGGNAEGLVWLAQFAQGLAIARDTALWLDGIPNVAGVWWPTKLLSSYSGPAIRVRRSSDNTESDIGFAGHGDIDTAALLSFVGAGNSGYRVTVYDQSGNGRHATEATASKQPRIVNAGVLETDGPESSLADRFDGTDDQLAASFTLAAPYAIFVAYRLLAPPPVDYATVAYSPNNNLIIRASLGAASMEVYGGWADVERPEATGTSARLYTFMTRSGSGSNILRINGADVAMPTYASTNSGTINGLVFGNQPGTSRAAQMMFRGAILLSAQPSSDVRDLIERKLGAGWIRSIVEAKNPTVATTASLLMNHGDRAGTGYYRSMVPFTAVGGPIVAPAMTAYATALITWCGALGACTPSVGECDNEDDLTHMMLSVAEWKAAYEGDARYSSEIIIDDGVTTQTGQQWAAANGNPDLTAAGATGTDGRTGLEYTVQLLLEVSGTAIRKRIQDPVQAVLPALRWKNFQHFASTNDLPLRGGGGVRPMVNTKPQLSLDSPAFYGVDLGMYQQPGESDRDCYRRVMGENVANWVAAKGIRKGIPWNPWPNAVNTPPGERWPDVDDLAWLIALEISHGVTEIQFWSDPAQNNPGELAQAMRLALGLAASPPPGRAPAAQRSRRARSVVVERGRV